LRSTTAFVVWVLGGCSMPAMAAMAPGPGLATTATRTTVLYVPPVSMAGDRRRVHRRGAALKRRNAGRAPRGLRTTKSGQGATENVTRARRGPVTEKLPHAPALQFMAHRSHRFGAYGFIDQHGSCCASLLGARQCCRPDIGRSSSLWPWDLLCGLPDVGNVQWVFARRMLTAKLCGLVPHRNPHSRLARRYRQTPACAERANDAD
jgi:hypothetical protein